MASSGTASEDYGLDRLEHDVEVERERQVLDIEEVVLQLLQRVFLAGAVGVVDLCPTRQARPDDVTLAVEGDFARELVDELRPFGQRPHEANLPHENIPQLGELIQPGAAQKS